MKKFSLILIFFTLAAGIVSAQEVNLKDAIIRSARGIEGELPQKAKVAVINFESPSKSFSDYVIDELSGELIEGKKITVVDRKNLATIMDEMKFQYSGYVSDESMQRIGKMLGAQAIISGSLTDIGANYRFRIKVINVETAAVQRQISLDLKKDTQVEYLLGGAKAAKEIEKEQEKAERRKPTSNVRNNWVSAELVSVISAESGIGVGIGVKYERMFGPYVSLGTNLFLLPIGTEPEIFGMVGNKNIVKQEDKDRGINYGIDGFFHWYPWGRTFYLGIALGYYNIGKKIDIYDYYYSSYYSGNYHSSGYAVGRSSGFGLTYELGWKIDAGKDGGFFLEPGLALTTIFGKSDFSNAPKNESGNVIKSEIISSDFFADMGIKIYFGVGWAF